MNSTYGRTERSPLACQPTADTGGQWSSRFTEAGFVLLSDERLATPLSDIDTSMLTRNEWRHIRSSGITTLGGALFNAWD